MNKEHIKEFGGRRASEVCRGRFGGDSRDMRELCVVPYRLDRMSAGQTGRFHWTHGTRPRDGCGPEVEVSR